MTDVLRSLDESLPGQYSRDFMRANGAVKRGETDAAVSVVITPDCSERTRDFLNEFHSPKTVEFVEVSRQEFASFIGARSAREVAVPTTRDKKNGLEIDTVAKDAPVVNIINAICIDAIARNSSDIHIESLRDSIRIRYRIDGHLVTVKTIDRSLFAQVSSRLKVMANLNIMEQRLPQDGRMTVSIGGETIDIRVSTMPITWGESIVLRLFDSRGTILTLENLGFLNDELRKITECLKWQTGLILATGPTGSGKTTTLHALLNLLNTEDRNIVALEDPVEQVIDGVNQVQINEEIGVSFGSMLRRVLRQDPNTIMVGEIRDSETADLALRSSLTGHLILSTLHTNDAISVVSRLRNMGVEPYLVSAVLRCSVAQRLVRRACPHCSKEVRPRDAEKRILERSGLSPSRVKEAVGCDRCERTGYSGRIVVEEVLVVDDTLRSMIETGAKESDLRRHARTIMNSMARNALAKIADGITTFAEVEREVNLA